MRHGDKVELLNPRWGAHRDRRRKDRRIASGTCGVIVALRDDADGRKALVKFEGHGGPRHTALEDLAFIEESSGKRL